MKLISVLLLIIVMQFVFVPVPKVYAATTTVNLLTTSNFAILAGTEITDSPTSTITGDVGLSPATGASIGLLSTQVTGTIYAVDAFGPVNSVNNPGKLTTATTDWTTAYNDAAGRSITATKATELGGQILTDGVYNSDDTTFQITSGAGALVLDGQGNADSVFIFIMNSGATGLTVGPGSTVSLINGASACNVFWKVNTATINTTATFKGTILANTSITVANGANIEGRLLASTGNVTLINDTITRPTCTSGSTTTSSSALTAAGIPQAPYCPAFSCVTPIILESRRVDADSIFLNWGPYAGMNQFSVQYGVENGKWLYKTNVTGFSTTLNDLPPNQPIWVLIQPRDNCSIGPCGVVKLIGGPLLPNTGFGSEDNNIPWYILVGSLAGISVFLSLIQRKYRFLSTH